MLRAQFMKEAKRSKGKMEAEAGNPASRSPSTSPTTLVSGPRPLTAATESGQWPAKRSPEEIWSNLLRKEDAERPPALVIPMTFPDQYVPAPFTARPDRIGRGEKHPLEGGPGVLVVKKAKEGNEKALRKLEKMTAGEVEDFGFPLSLPGGASSPGPQPVGLAWQASLARRNTSGAAADKTHSDSSTSSTSSLKMRSNNTPRSPLSAPPKMPSTPDRPQQQQQQQQPPPELNLPKFHPLFFENRHNGKASSPSSSRPSSSRDPLSPQLQARKGGNFSQRQAQQLQQYHRDVLARAAASIVAPPSTTDAPKAPHLVPCGSPGPATPLNLEEPKDYMTARAIGEGSPRATADKFVREEQERRNGMHVERSSPAVSPRC